MSKTTIKRYIDYLEAAFLIKMIHRVDRNARRFKRANFFKVYLTNPSMRAALFNIMTEHDGDIGHLIETAVYSQWFHVPELSLHYARWAGGEVDIVKLGPQQKAEWAIEVKWSDRYFERPEELKAVVQFCHEQNLPEAMITTKNVLKTKMFKNVRMVFAPASLYCYILSSNIIHRHPLLAGIG